MDQDNIYHSTRVHHLQQVFGESFRVRGFIIGNDSKSGTLIREQAAGNKHNRQADVLVTTSDGDGLDWVIEYTLCITVQE